MFLKNKCGAGCKGVMRVEVGEGGGLKYVFEKLMRGELWVYWLLLFSFTISLSYLLIILM